MASGQCLAVIALTDRADGHAFESRDLASARLLAAPAALALARHRVSESLDELTRAATVDPVTGLFNRRYFEAQIQAEVQRARRQQQDLALLMVDIDDFKRINDTLGHLEGDRALRDVANLLRRGVRIFDVCARYGGEEFAILMPGATRHVAVQVAERIRRGIQDRSLQSAAPMTVSVGVGFLEPDHTEEDLIGAADRALMAAKRAGKNVVKTEMIGWIRTPALVVSGLAGRCLGRPPTSARTARATDDGWWRILRSPYSTARSHSTICASARPPQRHRRFDRPRAREPRRRLPLRRSSGRRLTRM